MSLEQVHSLLRTIQDEAGPSSYPALQEHVLKHSLFSRPLTSSADLAKSITQLTEQHEREQKRLARSRQTALDALRSTSSRISHFRASLDDLPTQVEALGDAIDTNAAQLDISNGNSLPARLQAQLSNIDSFLTAEDYYAMLARAQSLWEGVAAHEKAAPGCSEALETLADLQHLCKHVRNIAASQEGVAEQLRLLPFLETKVRETYSQLASLRMGALRIALEHAGWPPLSAEQAEAQGKSPVQAAEILTQDSVKHSWRALTSLQIVGSTIGLDSAPSCLLDSGPSLEPERSLAEPLRPGSDEYQPLWTTAVLVEPYLLRFKFHFDSARSTNRLDKPEWYLNHVLGLLHALLPLFQTDSPDGLALKLGRPALHRHGQSFSSYPQTDIIHMLLQALQGKISTSLPLLMSQGKAQLLAHTVTSLIAFDDSLESLLPPQLGSMPIRLAESVLSSDEWFSVWVRLERDAAFDALDAILEDAEAWSIGADGQEGLDDDHDDNARPGTWAAAAESAERGSSDEMKTTRSAAALVRLIASLTDSYKLLPHLSQRLAFLLEIQLPLLRTYHQRLTRSLDAFESLSSAFARAIPGGMTDSSTGMPLGDQDMVRGLRGLSRLLKAYLSAAYVVRSMLQWQEQSFFIELSHDLLASDSGRDLLRRQREEAEERELDGESLGSLIRKSLRGSSTTPSGSHLARAEDRAEIMSVWAEPLQRFTELRDRGREGLRRLITNEVADGMKEYTLQTWTDEVSPFSEGADADDEGASVPPMDSPTPSLLPALSSLHMHCSRLLPVLDARAAVVVYQAISQTIAEGVVQRVVFAGGSKRFTQAGGERFCLDWERGWKGVLATLQKQQQQTAGDVVASATTLSKLGLDAERPWRYLRDAAILLALPAQQSEGGEDRGGWTLARATLVLWSSDPETTQWTTMCRELGLSSREIRQSGDAGKQRAREILRRRVECLR
ncbi:unnamed protein product [Parajaminaea phylloscopi]